MRSIPYFVGIAGASCSGKSSLASALGASLPGSCCVSLDAYYVDLSAKPPDERARSNFDVPEALDWPLIRAHVRALAAGEAVDCPVYDFVTHTRAAETVRLAPAPHVIVEGLFTLYDAALRRLLQTRVFVDVSADVALSRRIARDVAERGRTPESVREQVERTVRPMMEAYVIPTRRHATVVVSGEAPIEQGARAVLAHVDQNASLGRGGA
ncbi:MAG TPA: uridine kinase [Candidatus Hydrogenedentes bacterium]|nr:uridine kinase [Candidatus Hydrogenedentota bacterium]HOS04306.1 uridine kinase [Candidatus Hydrogenedentota bacterium]